MAEPVSAREIVNKLDEAIEARITGGAVVTYSIAGRSINKEGLASLLNLREYYSRIADEQESGGGVTYADLRGI